MKHSGCWNSQPSECRARRVPGTFSPWPIIAKAISSKPPRLTTKPWFSTTNFLQHASISDVCIWSSASLLLGTGASYADVLTSGPLASQRKGLALLVDGTGSGADSASRAFLEANASSVKEVAILGGSGAVNAAADRAVQAALHLSST